jgi:hypothetical protein
MIPASDLWMLGLRAVSRTAPAHMVPTSGAAQPFREMGEMFPDWAARPVPGPSDAGDTAEAATSGEANDGTV